MSFSCRQCGSCCMYLGDYIVIEHQFGPFEFACCSVSTDTSFIAHIDKDKRHLFVDHSFPDQHLTACPFLRPEDNLLRCTIHRDSPCQCKSYRCVVMQISDSEGKRIGHVTGTLALHSDDIQLRAVWEEAERKRPRFDDKAETWLADFLKANGYRVK